MEGDALHAPLWHLLLLRIICVRLARFDHLDGILVQLIKIVGGVRNLVSADLEDSEVLEVGLLEFSLQYS